MTGKIFDIKRFAVHDGNGIRTTVFFKGCPLKCIWCHNPEGISFESELQFVNKKCVGCGVCGDICPNDAHEFKDGIHTIDRDKCTRCGLCSKVCVTEALSPCKREFEADELVKILLEDAEFYRQSNGGVTMSGGECLCQADFCAEVMKKLKYHNIHCAVDTCGCVPRSEIDKVLPYTDVFLYDIKHISEEEHKKYTGQSNKLILENLQYIDYLGKEIEIRIPLIPTINDYAIEDIALFLKDLRSVKRVKLLPYNNLAGSKYENIGMTNTMPNVNPPTDELMKFNAEKMRKYGINAVIG